MILSPNMHEIALQSDADVREFRYIFDLHYVPFGSSKNLAGFLRELRENSDFAMDIWALIRSIRLKEKGYLTHQELFTLIVIAVAGPDFSISNSHMNDLLEEFDNLLASRREDVSTGRKLRQDPFPPTAFPHTPERTDHKGSSVGNQSSTGSAVQTDAQSHKGRNAALAVFLLFLATAYFGNIMARTNRSERAEIMEAASAQETTADVLVSSSVATIPDSTVNRSFSATPGRSTQANPSRPAIAITGPASDGSGEASSLGKNSIPMFSKNAVAEISRFRSADKPSTLHGTPILLVGHNANSSATAKVPAKSYIVGKSHRVSLSSGAMTANLLESHPPQYPKLASLTHVQGPVVLQAIVSKRGTVESIHVMKGPYLLRGAASNAVRSWRYKPYISNGKTVEVATIVTVDFSL